jgi:sugar lactone lactonase YvrE
MSAVRIVESDAVLPVQCANALTGKAPYWDEDRQTLWWVDIQGSRLLGFTPRTGKTEEHSLPGMPALVVSDQHGRIVIGLEDGLYTFDLPTGQARRIIAFDADGLNTRANDGKVDPRGRLWFGTMDKSRPVAPIGSLRRVDPDRTVRIMRQNVRIPNAITFSPDGRTLYFADTPTQVIEAIAYDPDAGVMGSARVFARWDADERPDGACVDAEGALWIAVINGSRIERRLPDGTLHTVINLPVSRPTMPALGGSDGRTLFITSQRRFLGPERLAAEPLAGDLLAVRVDVPAHPSSRMSAGAL